MPAPKIQQLDQPQSLTEIVIDRLRDAIINGDFGLGENISEDRLASAFGVSRSPIRDALNALQFIGLVEVRPKRGSFVFDPSQEQVDELCDFRFILEKEAAGLAVQHDRAGLLAALDAQIAAMQKAEGAGDQQAYARADTAYHAAFFAHCGNRLVINAYSLADARVATLRTLLTVPEDQRRQSSFDENVRLRQLLASGDMAAFNAMLGGHISRTKSVALAVLFNKTEAGA